MTRSRLRRPTSKSTTTTFSPPWANAAPSAAVDVVLPTPPLPDVTTKILAILVPSFLLSVQGSHDDGIAVQRDLNRLAAMVWTEVVRGLVKPVDGDELGFEFPAEDPGAAVAGRARDGASAQRAVDVDRAAGDDLGARGNGAQHRHVAIH